jgi:hypothetical protein
LTKETRFDQGEIVDKEKNREEEIGSKVVVGNEANKNASNRE